MEQQKRLLLGLTLSFLLWMAALYLFPETFRGAPPPEPTAATAVDGGTPPASAAAPTPPAAPPPGGAQVAAPSTTPPAAELPPVRAIPLQGEQMDLSFSSQGAGLTKAEFKGDKMREQQRLTILQGYKRVFGGEVPEAPPMDMGRPMADRPLPLAVEVRGPRPFSPSARYAVQESPDGRTLTLTGQEGDTQVTKIVEWPRNGFELKMTVAVKNLGAEPLGGELALHYARHVEPGSEEKASMFGGVGNESHATCSFGDSTENLAPDGKPPSEFKGPINFFGVNQQYFLGALFPLEGPREGRCILEAVDAGRLATALFPITVAPGQEIRQSYGVFIGPKELDLLRTVPLRMKELGMVSSSAAPTSWSEQLGAAGFPHLDRSVDFGIWAAICRVLLPILRFFYSVFHNWGVAIILLTVVVKLVLLPLTHKSMVAAEGMKKLQPKMEEIRKKYAEDRERQGVEMAKLYQEAKVNPFSGCLPLLLQLPVWGALFTTLRQTYELYREPFLSPLWTDLTFKDPTYLLPFALGVTMIITQRLQPQMMDAVQARMMTYVMPIFFTAIMINYPAGLTLYIFTNNLLSIAQQYLLRRYLEKKGIATPGPKPKQEKEKPRREPNERQPGRKRSDP
jgi:YidC/Oxa1 family membrane protein insertase